MIHFSRFQLKLGFALSLCLLGSKTFSATPAQGGYWGLFGGLSHISSTNFNISTSSFTTINTWLIALGYAPLATTAGELQYSSIGGNGGGQVGYRYCGFRFEGELIYDFNGYSQVTIDGITLSTNQNTSLVLPFSNLDISGHTALGAALFNIFYDFYDMDYDDVTWLPYIGLGIGYGYVQNQLDINYLITTSTGTTTTTLLEFKKNSTTPVGQAILGISYLFNDNFSAGLDYRYISTRKVAGFNEHLRLQTLNLNFNYWFDA